MRRLWVSLVSLALAGAAIGGGISVAAETDDPAPVSVLKVSPEFAANAGEALKAARPVAPAKTPTQAPAGPSRAELERTATAHAGRLSASAARKLVAEHSPALTRPDVIVPKAEDIASIVGGNALREKGKPGVRISNFPIAIASVSNATRDGIQRKPGAGLEADARQLDSSGGDVVDLAPETTWKLVDLDLAVKGDRIAVDRPVVDVSLPAMAGGVAQIGDLGLRLAPAGSDSAGVIADQSVVYPNVSTDTDLVARATSIGLAVGWSIRTPDASREVRMPLDLPGGVRPVVTRTGEVQLLDRNDRLFGNVSIATARDADKASVPVQMAVEGSTIVYRVEHAAGKVAYPITLDPTVSVDWRTTVPDPSDGWFSFSTPYGTTQPFLYSRNTQSSTQQGGLAIGAPASAAYALDAAGAWGRFAPGNPAVGTVQSPATGRKISPEHAWWYRFDAGAVNYLTIPTQWYHAYNNPYGTAAILNRDGLLMPSMWQGQSSGTGPTDAAYGPAQSGIPALTTATTGAGASVWIGTANTGAGVNPSDATDNTLTLSLQQPKLFYQNDHPATALAMGWYSAYTADNVAPQVTASSPSGWLGLTYTIPVSATDNGLGIKAFQLQAADGVPIGTPTTKDCVQTASKICEFTASADVPVEPAQEGIHTFKATATDAGGRTGTQNITLKIDKTAPELTLSGTMFTQRDTELSTTETRTLTINTADGTPGGGPDDQRSGVARIEIYVDGDLAFTEDQTQPGDNQPLNASWTPPRSLFTNAEGGNEYNVEVVAIDRLGHEKSAEFTVKTPATELAPENQVVQDSAKAFLEDDGLSAAQASTALDDQNKSEILHRTLDDALDEKYTGMWPDRAARRIKVAVTNDVADSVVQAAAVDAGLSGLVDVVHRTASWTDLQDATESMTSALGDLLQAGKIIVTRDAQNGRLQITKGSALTSAEQAHLSSVIANATVPVITVDDPAETFGVKNTACDNNGPLWGCDRPLRGSLPLKFEDLSGGKGWCTTGFIARRNSDGAAVVLTAGHCTKERGVADWYVPTANGWALLSGLGTDTRSIVDKRGDFGYVQISASSTFRHSRSNIVRVYADGQAGTQRDPNYRINKVRYSPNPDKRKGFVLCLTGTDPANAQFTAATPRQRCGTVQDTGVSMTTTDDDKVGNLAELNVCHGDDQRGIKGGNSGAPVYKDHVAYGIVQGIYVSDGGIFGQVSKPCRVYYSSARGAEKALGVTIRRG